MPLVLAVLLCLPLVSTPALAERDVIAKVGGVPVTRWELAREVARRIPMASFHGNVAKEKVAEIKEQARRALVERAYQVCGAKQQGLAVTRAEVDAELARVRKQFKSEGELAKALNGEPLVAFTESIERQLLARKAEQAAIGSRATATAAQVRAAYDSNRKMYFMPRRYKASHILVKVPPKAGAEERAKLRQKAADLLAKARKGEDFYNLAYYNSDDRTKWVGGSLGEFHKGQAAPAFDAAIDRLKPGQISDVVETEFGLHIIQLHAVHEARQLELKEVEAAIRQRLEGERAARLRKAWMGELKKKCKRE